MNTIQNKPYDGKLIYKGYEKLYNLLYEKYYHHSNIIQCTYYSIAHNEIQFETDGFNAGSYHFIGHLSSYRWHKIYMMPMHNLNPVQIRVDTSEEEGIRYVFDSSIEFPTMYGVEPIIGDILIFDNPINPELKMPFVVTGGIEKSNISNKYFSRVNITGYPIKVSELDNQVINTYCYIDLFRKIYKIEDALILLKSIETKINKEKIIKTFYNGVHKILHTKTIN